MVKRLSETLEMYLKTILVLEREYNPVRVNQIARARGVSAASVTEAIRSLQDKGLILHKAYKSVRLSAEGRRTAQTIEHRYTVLHRFLVDVLGLSEAVAESDACEFEHVASTETIDRLAAFLKRAGENKSLSDVVSRFREDTQ